MAQGDLQTLMSSVGFRVDDEQASEMIKVVPCLCNALYINKVPVIKKIA